MSDVSDFIGRLLTNLRAIVSPDQYSGAVNDARAYAGGKGKAKRRKSPASDSGGGGGGGGGGRCAEEGRTVILSEITLSADGRSGTVQIFPEQGTYQHPWYGELNFDEQFFKDIQQNFDARIYQQDIPINVNLEHESQLSGAVGWFQSLEARESQSDKGASISGMWATVKFNERGTALVQGDQYRYFSSEFYDQWTDPATSKVYSHVLVGGALTNRPFFKGMEPVALLSESRLKFYEYEDISDLIEVDPEITIDDLLALLQRADSESESDSEGEQMSDEVSDEITEEITRVPEEEDMAGMTEDQAREFDEVKASLKALTDQLAAEKSAREAAESQAQRSASEIAAMREAQERRELSEFVREHRLAFREEVDASVDRLIALKAALSPDLFEAELEDRRATQSRLSEAEIFAQRSRVGDPVPTATELDSLVQVKVSQGKAKPAALAEVFAERPDLYEKYNRDQNRRAANAG